MNKSITTKGVDRACYLLGVKENSKTESGFIKFSRRVAEFFTGSDQNAMTQERQLKVKEIERKEENRLEELCKAEEGVDSALAEAVERLACLKDDPHQMAIIALSATKAAMKTLVSILLTISFFWSRCEIEFKSIGQLSSIEDLKTISNPEIRKTFWQSRAFKNAAFQSVVRFTAVQKMCKDSQRTLTPVLEDIHLCIRDNPTRREAQRKLLPLVEEFQRKTVKKRAALDQIKSSRDAQSDSG